MTLYSSALPQQRCEPNGPGEKKTVPQIGLVNVQVPSKSTEHEN